MARIKEISIWLTVGGIIVFIIGGLTWSGYRLAGWGGAVAGGILGLALIYFGASWSVMLALWAARSHRRR